VSTAIIHIDLSDEARSPPPLGTQPAKGIRPSALSPSKEPAHRSGRHIKAAQTKCPHGTQPHSRRHWSWSAGWAQASGLPRTASIKPRSILSQVPHQKLYLWSGDVRQSHYRSVLAKELG
jgi:hypothetical protein